MGGLQMTWQVNEHEFRRVITQPAKVRYKYFVSRVADWKQLWSLRNQEGWIQAHDEEGRILFPIWPHHRYADACATGPWQDCHAELIDLDVWLDRWIPGMTRDKRWVAVFPTPQCMGICVSAEQLERDLRAELARLIE
jgi:hypothetical protein